MNGRPWTTSEARRLAELRKQRVTVKLIAEALGRTENAVVEFLRYVPAVPGKPAHKKPIDRLPHVPRMAPPPKPRDDYWKRDELALLRQLAAEGSSAKEVALALGRPLPGVKSKAWREGIRFHGGGQSNIFRLDQESAHFRRNAEEGSAQLRDAILLALAA